MQQASDQEDVFWFTVLDYASPEYMLTASICILDSQRPLYYNILRRMTLCSAFGR